MRISNCRGSLFSFTFLAIFAISHAFVFWIPIWKSTSVIRHHPKKGWTPVKSRGTSFGILKPKHIYNFYSPSNQHLHPSSSKTPHHFYSTFNRQYRHSPHESRHHHPHHKWKSTVIPWKKSPLANLNGHHPLCPLCHLAHYWNKVRKPHHHHHGHFSPSNNFPKINNNPHHSIFSHFPKLRNPFYKYGPHRHYSPQSPSEGPDDTFPKFGGFPTFPEFGPKFGPKFGQNSFAPIKTFKSYPKHTGSEYPKKSHNSYHKSPSYQKGYHHKDYNNQGYHRDRDYDYPTKSHKNHYQRKPVSYNYNGYQNQQSAAPSGPAENYMDMINYAKTSHSPSYVEHSDNPSIIPPILDAPPIDMGGLFNAQPMIDAPTISPPILAEAPPQQQQQVQQIPEQAPEEFSKDFSKFGGFSGFGAGEKGHGWEGWDW